MPLVKKRLKMTNEVLMWSTQMWAVAAFLIGVLTIVGGEMRWSAEVYEFLTLVPGSPEIWGVFLIALTLIVAYAIVRDSTLAMQIGLIGLGVWCVAFAVGVVFATMHTPTVALSASVWLWVSAAQYFFMAKLWREFGSQGGELHA